MTYNPNDLDPDFAEAAARMSAKFDELAKDKPSDVPSKYPIPPDAGPLKGWAKDPFFDPAIALSGQDLGLIEAVYNVINEVWTHTNDKSSAFTMGMAQALSKWSGPAATECAMYVGALKDFIDDERDCLFTLARGLVTYAAIIDKSRKSLAKLMQTCVDGWNQAGHVSEAANLSVETAVLTTVSAIGFTVITGGTDALTLPLFGNAIMGIAASITNNAANMAGKSNEIAGAFLREAQTLLTEAADAIDRTAQPDLVLAQEILPQLQLTLPEDLGDKGKFHPDHGSPASSKPSRINKALG